MQSKLTTREWLFLAVLIVLVVLCYGQTAGHSFIWDTVHIFVPEAMRDPSPASIGWVFTNTVIANWHPLSLLTHLADYWLHGDYSGGHHLTNVGLHVLVCLAVYALVRTLLREHADLAIPVAMLTALVFALHPLRVESVAWVAARKDLLYSLFYLLALWVYVARVREQRHLFFVWVLFGLALLSKSMAVTLPVVLVLLDLYPLRRWSLDKNWLSTLLPLLLEKLPLFVMAVAVIVVTLVTQENAMALQLSPIDQLKNAVHNVVFYLQHFVLPLGLSPFYPFPSAEYFNSVLYWLPQLILIVAISLFALLRAVQGQAVWLVCWAAYLVMLAPASGAVHVGSAVAADRYTYLSLLPANFLLALGVVVAVQRFVTYSRMIALAMAMVLLTLGGLTWMQTRHWQNPVTFWSHVLRVYPDTALAHRNLASAYLSIGDAATATEHLMFLVLEGWPVSQLLADTIVQSGNRQGFVVLFENLIQERGLQEGGENELARTLVLLRSAADTGPGSGAEYHPP